MTRAPVAFVVVALILAVVVWDLRDSTVLNPFQAPPVLALGSGQAASGAHCAAPPK